MRAAPYSASYSGCQAGFDISNLRQGDQSHTTALATCCRTPPIEPHFEGTLGNLSVSNFLWDEQKHPQLVR